MVPSDPIAAEDSIEDPMYDVEQYHVRICKIVTKNREEKN